MTTRTSPREAGAVRCSDTEREQTATKLQAAAAEGRLTLEEVEDRLARSYAARYRNDLDDLLADLPAPAAPKTGWAAVFGLARTQILADLAGLLGRGEQKISQRRRITVLATLVIAALLVLSMILLALHGITGDGGHEYHGFEHG